MTNTTAAAAKQSIQAAAKADADVALEFLFQALSVDKYVGGAAVYEYHANGLDHGDAVLAAAEVIQQLCPF